MIWFSFDFVWDFLLVSLYLSFFFPLFFFFSCWLSLTYDLIWIFVAFLTAIGVVSLKSDFTSQYQNCNFIIRYLIIAHARCFIAVFLFFSFIFISSFIHFLFCFDFFSLAVLYSYMSQGSWPRCRKQEPIRFSESGLMEHYIFILKGF